ncbi:aminodeoxychorismate synthase component 1 [Klebsiella sp. BIGb0407]|uniref:aminodeoxychorismate synthase component 1 n=1 Tax=Klebsiella sp. BIGb0407 TaxID=2940603 RepID=UPI0021681F6D|nr:aminodeoxychorismate synthase component 1 [Klebsiella sp. BIGb0407]MCS3430372.1 para-aminobenzoate synthetase component 1 [Klebsiella sp. BIGb0407]
MKATKSPVFHILPWQTDAVQHYFKMLSHQPWAMMLHSGCSDHPYSRFDIMVADPRATLVTEGKTTTIIREGISESSDRGPLTLLQNTLESYGLTCAPQTDYPFCGGALGLLGYDLGRHFETLPEQAEKSLYTPDMAVGIYDWALIADNQLQRLTLVSWGDINQRLAYLDSLSQPSPTPFHLTSAWQSNMSREQYGVKFNKIQEYLRSGDCYQVNLAQRFSASYRGDEWQAFEKLNQANRAPFSAFLRLPGSAILSLSPERFVRLQDKQIQTRPIKGTLPRLADPKLDREQALKLASSPKDRAENLMIVDLLRNDIGRVARPGSVRVPELFVVEPFAAVHHLVSTITAELPDDLNACDLLRATFPGGSITGAPKVRAMEIIEELEPQRRNAWCGSIVYISFCGNMDSSITIRTLTAEQGKLYCSAGGGIVADSDVSAEYQETFDKVNRILPLLES